MPNASKRLLIACVIDISPSTAIAGEFGSKTANRLINEHLKVFIDQLLENVKIRTAAEICFVTYSSEVKVYGFKPLKEYLPQKENENKVPRFEAVKHGGTRTAAAVEAAYKAIHERAHNIMSLSSGAGLYTSTMLLLTDGSKEMHDTQEVRDRVAGMVNECTVAASREKQVLPFIVGLGDNLGKETEAYLLRLSKDFLNGFIHIPGGKDGNVERNYAALFEFISKSLVDISNRQEDYVTAAGDSADKVVDESERVRRSNEQLANQLRKLVGSEYDDMIRTETGGAV